MADIFDKILVGFNKGVQSIKNTSEQAVEKAGLKQNISNLENNKKELIYSSGMLAYNIYKEGHLIDDRLKNVFAEIDNCDAQIAELNAKLEEMAAAAATASAPVPTGPMKVCQNCGTRNEIEARFCAGCGNDITNAPVPTQPQGNGCPRCGMVNEPGAKFCAGCGNALSAAAPAPAPAPAPEPKPEPKPEPTPEPVFKSAPSSETVNCVICGAPNEPGVKFCAGCGVKLSEDTADNICPDCGIDNAQGAKFCRGCGKQF